MKLVVICIIKINEWDIFMIFLKNISIIKSGSIFNKMIKLSLIIFLRSKHFNNLIETFGIFRE